MAQMMRMLVLAIFLNIFVYLGVGFVEVQSGNVQSNYNDLFGYFLTSPDDLSSGVWDYYSELDDPSSNQTSRDPSVFEVRANSSFSKLPDPIQSSESGIFNLLDVPAMILDFLGTILNIIFLPYTLMFSGVLPILVGVIIGIPLLIVNITTLIMFLRGSD